MNRVLLISVITFGAAIAAPESQVVAKSCKPPGSYGVDANAAKAGKVVFIRCASCHEMGRGQSRRIGPTLGTMFDGKPLAAPGYNYSQAFKKARPNWTDLGALDRFLAKPSAVVPGTKMVYAGLPKVNDRKNLIAYLRSELGYSGCK